MNEVKRGSMRGPLCECETGANRAYVYEEAEAFYIVDEINAMWRETPAKIRNHAWAVPTPPGFPEGFVIVEYGPGGGFERYSGPIPLSSMD